jgi:hypothetical protein
VYRTRVYASTRGGKQNGSPHFKCYVSAFKTAALDFDEAMPTTSEKYLIQIPHHPPPQRQQKQDNVVAVFLFKKFVSALMVTKSSILSFFITFTVL